MRSRSGDPPLQYRCAVNGKLKDALLADEPAPNAFADIADDVADVMGDGLDFDPGKRVIEADVEGAAALEVLNDALSQPAARQVETDALNRLTVVDNGVPKVVLDAVMNRQVNAAHSVGALMEAER